MHPKCLKASSDYEETTDIIIIHLFLHRQSLHTGANHDLAGDNVRRKRFKSLIGTKEAF